MLGGLLLGAPLAAATSYSFAIVSSAALAAVAVGVALLLREERREPAPDSRSEAARSYRATLGAGIRTVRDKPALRALFVFSAVVSVAAAGPVQLLQPPCRSAHQLETSML